MDGMILQLVARTIHLFQSLLSLCSISTPTNSHLCTINHCPGTNRQLELSATNWSKIEAELVRNLLG
jgi:hypothetical protein